MKPFISIAAGVLLSSSSAFAGTTVCQPLGDATACSDGTIVQPLGDGAYVTKTPRDSWGQRLHDNRGENKRSDEEGSDR